MWWWVVDNGTKKRIIVELKESLFVPDLRINLVSVAKITNQGHKIIFIEAVIGTEKFE